MGALLIQPKISLQAKIKALIKELRPIAEVPQMIEDIVPFFRATTLFMDSMSPNECEVADQQLHRFMGCTGRGAWNGTPLGVETKFDHISINPTGHFDEFYNNRTLRDLVENPGNKFNQFGFANWPMDDKEFYYECFVKPFMANNFRFLVSIHEKFQTS